MISLKNVNHSFADKVVFRDLNLEIQPSHIHSMIGLTGAGKTLLLKILAGLTPLQDGSIQTPCKKVSFVFQQNSFLPWLSMAENLQIATKLDILFIKERLQAFHLVEYINLFPKQLSGGTLQKFNLLRAFIINADLILLDEPFSHLDIVQKEDLYQFMLNLWLAEKPTIILVTHDIDEALMLSNSISFLSKKSFNVVQTLQLNQSALHSQYLSSYRENNEFKKHYSVAYEFLRNDLK